MKVFNTLEPNLMEKLDLVAVCSSLQIAKNWGQKCVEFKLSSGETKKVNVSQIDEYRKAFSPITGQTKV